MSQQTNAPGPNGQKTAALVFVVDDEPMLLELADVILSAEGYRLEKFQYSDAALKAFQAAETKPDLLITDYNLGAINGLELIAQCRRIKPELKTIMISGSLRSDAYSRSNVKADGFLGKPYKSEQLAGLVRTLMAK